MWNPGFPYSRIETATLEGYRRALCVYSWVWRGTREKPGLVFGLAPGGRCEGRAIGVSPETEADVLAYLDARELVTDVYERRKVTIAVADGRREQAWTYVARPDHEQFAGDLDADDALYYVRQGRGQGGANNDYVKETFAHLRELGIDDLWLERLVDKLD